MPLPSYPKLEGIDAKQEPREGIIVEDGLSLDLSDEKLNQALDTKIQTSRDFLEEKLNWRKKMRENEDIWLGKHLDDLEMYPWQLEYVNNIIFRSIETIIPIAIARIPTPEIVPAQNTKRSIKLASDLEDVLVYRFRQEKMRSRLRLALRHLLIYKLGIIKCVWDPELGIGGDFTFKNIHPSKLKAFDHTATSSDELGFVVELVNESAKVAGAKFPDKRAELYRALGIMNPSEEDKKFTYEEAWFTYYNDQGEPQEGLLWRYGHLILKKTKDPNWDWEGGDKNYIDEAGEDVAERTFHNFLERPRKPYIFMSYLGLGKQLPDETSLLEQSWTLQKNVNKRGMQITEMADKAQGKMAISTDYMTSSEAERITDDPNEHIRGAGDIRAGVMHIPGQAPDRSLFEDKAQNVTDIDNMMGSHSTTRGERGKQETLGGRMLLREADYGRIDDLVQEAIEIAVGDAFQLATQFMKLRYTETHYMKIKGRDGKFDFKEFSRDSIEDGVEIYVRSGSSLPVDKLSKRMEAIELAGGDKITLDDLYERLGWDDPIESAIKTVVYQGDPLKYAQILASGDKFKDAMAKMAEEPPAQAGAQPGVPPEQAPLPGAPPGMAPPAGVPMPGAQPGAEDEASIAEATDTLRRMREFAESPAYQELTDEEKEMFVTQMRTLQEAIKGIVG